MGLRLIFFERFGTLLVPLSTNRKQAFKIRNGENEESWLRLDLRSWMYNDSRIKSLCLSGQEVCIVG